MRPTKRDVGQRGDHRTRVHVYHPVWRVSRPDQLCYCTYERKREMKEAVPGAEEDQVLLLLRPDQEIEQPGQNELHPVT